MAFIPTESRGASLGGLLGTSLGSGLAQQVQSNIDLLMHQKAQKMAQAAQESQQSKLAQAFQVLNIPREQAEAIAALPPKLQELALYNAEQRSMPQMQEAPVSALESLQQMPQQEYPRGAMTSLIGGKPGPVVAPAQPQMQPISQPQQRQLQSTAQPKQAGGFFAPVAKPGKETPEHKSAVKKFDEYKNKGEAAADQMKMLDAMEELIDSGNLNNAAYVSLIKAPRFHLFGSDIGPDLTFALTEETQAFDKLSGNFVKYAKQYFGSRMTQGEVNQFLKTIPSSLNTEAGKRLLLKQKRIELSGDEFKSQIARNIVEMNGGRVPDDLDTQVERLYKPYEKPLADQFKQNTKEARREIKQSQIKVGQKFSSMPDASRYPVNTELKDKANNRTLVVVETPNGKEWQERKG